MLKKLKIYSSSHYFKCVCYVMCVLNFVMSMVLEMRTFMHRFFRRHVMFERVSVPSILLVESIVI